MLLASQLTGFNANFGGAASVAYQTSASDSTNLTTYTFASQALGTARSDRVIVVAVIADVAAVAVSSMTIGGVSAVEQIGGANGIALWSAVVPTGTTGNIVVTWASGRLRCAIAVWAVYGLNSATATATNSGTTDNSAVTLAVQGGGVAIACGRSGANTTCTWTGVTENADLVAEAATALSGGSTTSAFAQTLSITGDFVTATSVRFINAAFR